MRKPLAFFVILTFCFSYLATAQSAAGVGSISGTVRDASGAAVPGASVEVANASKGITREMTTTEAGLFSAPGLVPASGYKVSVKKQGFAPYEVSEIVVQVGETINLNVALKVGAVAETVEVSAAAPLVDDTKTEVSQVVGSQLIQDLPINGRRVDTFVLLTPAVTNDGTFGLVSFRGVLGGNAFLTDGNDTTNQYYLENAGRTRAHSQISQDAVQEFQVLTAVASAEFGRANGGVINTVTKSGGNGIHGSAFWFFRNRTLNARDRFATINPPEVRNQSGFTIGGPIVKDKLFYFGDIEITRRHNPIASSIINNNVNFATQSFIGCAAPATAAQCAAINTILPREFGLIDRRQDEELAFLKLDYRPDFKNSFSISMNYMRFISPMGVQTGATSTSGAALGTNGDDSVRDRYGKISWTYVPNGAMVNEFRFGWFKDRQADDVDPTYSKGWPIGATALSVGGVSPLSGYNVLPRINPSENRYQFVDVFSWNKGRHAMKFGFDSTRTEDYSLSLTDRFGSYTYSTVTAFAQDFTSPAAGPSHYQSYLQRFGNPIVDTQIPDIAWFAQDNFKATRKLTLNAGVRYERAFLPQPTLKNPDYPQTGIIHQSTKNFAPRVGFAYAINDKTVFRGGFGLFFARPGAGMINTLFTNNNIYTQSLTISSPTATGAPVFPNVLASPAGAPGTGSIVFASPTLRTPYTEQLDLAIERALTKSTSMTVSYIMSRGKQLLASRDLNVGPLSSTVITYKFVDSSFNPTGQTWSTPIYLLANRVDTRYTRINQVENGPMSWYDGLAVQVNQKFSHGFAGTIAYTWSHALDEGQSTGGNSGSTIFFSAGPTLSYFNGSYHNDKGTGQLDQRQRFVSTILAHPTFTHSNSSFAKYVVNGWEFNGLLTLATKRPTFETISSQLSAATFAGAFTGSLNGFGGDNRVPFLPQNPLFLDPITRFDARISKTLPFGERFKLYLTFEAFNVTNTVSNTSVISAGFYGGNRGNTGAAKFVIAPCNLSTGGHCKAVE